MDEVLTFLSRLPSSECVDESYVCVMAGYCQMGGAEHLVSSDRVFQSLRAWVVFYQLECETRHA